MNPKLLTATLVVIVALLLAACSPAATTVAPTDTPVPKAGSGQVITESKPGVTNTPIAPTATAPAATAASSYYAANTAQATVDLGNKSTLGNFLVDSKGMTLYMFTKDTAGVSNCSGGCTVNWPPLLTTGTPGAGSGVDASKLGTITRSDGSKQVTYNNEPLYYFAGDKNPGDTTGQGVGSVWYVVAP
jgi:predicted lipoprotein with Yx(FWY)xxD motif